MKEELTPENKSFLDKLLEKNTHKKNAFKKIIRELEKKENTNESKTKN